MAAPDGIFFDEKAMLAMGWPFGVVQMLRRVFESDAVNLQTEIDANSDNIFTLQADKANKIDPATVDNIVIQLADGDIADSGVDIDQIGINTSSITDIENDKADKISSPTTGNLISQDAGGNIQDAGVDISDLVMIVGTGNPNGAVTSNNARQFFDTAGGVQYNNPAVGVNTGWVAI